MKLNMIDTIPYAPFRMHHSVYRSHRQQHQISSSDIGNFVQLSGVRAFSKMPLSERPCTLWKTTLYSTAIYDQLEIDLGILSGNGWKSSEHPELFLEMSYLSVRIKWPAICELEIRRCLEHLKHGCRQKLTKVTDWFGAFILINIFEVLFSNQLISSVWLLELWGWGILLVKVLVPSDERANRIIQNKLVILA